MPAGTSFAPGRLPIRLSFFFRLPEHEIQRVFFEIARHFNISVPRLQIVDIFMGKLAVLFKFTGSVIDGPVCRGICIAFFDQPGDHLDHTVDFFCRKRMRRCRKHVHIGHVFFAFFNKPAGHFFRRTALIDCLLNNFIVHVREIGYKIDVISDIFHITPYGIEYDHRPCISDMDIIVYGRPADIHFYFSLFQRYKLFFLSR